jgi:phenylalanine-4-hydroxylase
MSNTVETKQEYGKYTSSDKKVWKLLFEKQVANLKENDMAVMEFWNGLGRLKIDNKIPKISEINVRLKDLGSDFQLIPVKGIVPDDKFFEYLRQGLFPVTVWVRPIDSLDYIEEPDMFHDLFGHVPFLVDKKYCHYLKKIGSAAKKIFKYKKYAHLRNSMSRIYWYTIEFGLVKMRHRFKIYGAGILSSYHESIKALSGSSEKRRYSVDLLNEQFEKDDFQEFYAYIEGNIKFLVKVNVNL